MHLTSIRSLLGVCVRRSPVKANEGFIDIHDADASRRTDARTSVRRFASVLGGRSLLPPQFRYRSVPRMHRRRRVWSRHPMTLLGSCPARVDALDPATDNKWATPVR